MVLATVLVCFITGLLAATELYFFHQVIPDWKSVADPDTYYLDVMKVVGGPLLFTVFSIVMCVSQFGAGFTGQVSAARLVYGMGRDNVLPRAVFGYLSPRSQSPTRNILLVGALAFVGTVLLPFGTACDLLNFGAYLGFMGVNLSTFWCHYLRPLPGHRRHFLWDACLPLAGFLLCRCSGWACPGRRRSWAEPGCCSGWATAPIRPRASARGPSCSISNRRSRQTSVGADPGWAGKVRQLTLAATTIAEE